MPTLTIKAAANASKNFFMTVLPMTSLSRSRFRTSAPDFFYDDAVIQLSFARAYASFKHFGVHFEHRKLLPDIGGLVEHEMDVFQGLLGAAFRREVAAQHFRPLGFHHLRVRGRAARHREKGRRIEPQAFGENETLGHGE